MDQACPQLLLVEERSWVKPLKLFESTSHDCVELDAGGGRSLRATTLEHRALIAN